LSGDWIRLHRQSEVPPRLGFHFFGGGWVAAGGGGGIAARIVSPTGKATALTVLTSTLPICPVLTRLTIDIG
jgi:hypothetical protein